MVDVYLSQKDQALIYDVLRQALHENVFYSLEESDRAANICNKMARKINKRGFGYELVEVNSQEVKIVGRNSL